MFSFLLKFILGERKSSSLCHSLSQCFLISTVVHLPKLAGLAVRTLFVAEITCNPNFEKSSYSLLMFVNSCTDKINLMLDPTVGKNVIDY